MSAKNLFSVEQFENNNNCIVTYPDGTCDIMTMKEVKSNFDIPITGGGGAHADYESALTSLMEDDVPGDFFSKEDLQGENENDKKKIRQFSSRDPSLL
jgi:hypothetical protein